MNARASGLTHLQRLAAAAACTLAATWFYVQASARAYVYDRFDLAPQLLRPWEELCPTLVILVLCRIAWAAAYPVLKGGAVGKRISASLIRVLPVSMVAHFLYVAAHAALWAFRELKIP
jgi:hypothetical protein